MNGHLSSLVYPLLFTALLTAGLLEAEEQKAGKIYNPRYTDRVCPPEYESTRKMMEGFVRVDHMGGRLRELFGASAPRSFADIELLVDGEDDIACHHFANQHHQIINSQVRLFDSAEAWYLHDVSFYEGGDFYFVVIGEGFMMDTDPKNPGKEGMVSSPIGGVVVYDKKTFKFVNWQLM